MITFPLNRYCDSHKQAIRVLNECSNELASINSDTTLSDYGAENSVLSSDYKSIKSTGILELFYNNTAHHYVLASLQYDSQCEIEYTKKGKAYIKVLGEKYKIDDFMVSKGDFDGVYTLSNTSALGVLFLGCGDSVYTKVIY